MFVWGKSEMVQVSTESYLSENSNALAGQGVDYYCIDCHNQTIKPQFSKSNITSLLS